MKKKNLVFLAVTMGLALSLGACDSTSSSDTETTAAETTAEETTEAETVEETAALPEFTWDGKDASQYVTLGQYEGLTYTLTDTSVSDEEIQDIIDQMLENSTTYEQITEGTVADTDTVNVDYVGKIDGETFSGGSATNQTISIPDGGYIDGFLESIVGAKVGDTVTANLTFPENYSASVAGKDVVFEITVNYIQGDAIIPELTDEWVNSYTGGDYTTVEGLQNYISTELGAEKESDAETAYEKEIWNAVLTNATVSSYPDNLQEYYYTDQKNLLITYSTYYGYTYEEYVEMMGYTVDEVEDILTSYAEKCALNSMVNQVIANIYGLSVSDEEYQSYIEDLASSYGYSDLDQLVLDAGGELQIKDGLLYDKVIAKIMESAVGVEAEETETADETLESLEESAVEETLEEMSEAAESGAEETAEETVEETTASHAATATTASKNK